MPIPETLFVRCQRSSCRRTVASSDIPEAKRDDFVFATTVVEGNATALFRSHKLAFLAAESAGWYVDAKNEICAECRPSYEAHKRGGLNV